MHHWRGYTMAIIAVAVAFAVRAILLGTIENRTPYITFFPAVIIVAMYGGLRAGLLATLLSAALASLFLIAPVGQLFPTNVADWLRLGIFLVSCIMICLLSEEMHRAQERATAAAATQRDQAEAALGRGEQRLQMALEGAGAGSWMLDLKTGRVEQDAPCARLFGGPDATPADFVTQEAVMARVDPGDRDDIQQRLSVAMEHNGGFGSEFRVRWPEGTHRWLSTLGKVVRNAQKDAVQIVGVNLDITDRKQAEEELRASNDLNRRTLEAMPAHTAVVDQHGQILAVNEAWTHYAQRNGAADSTKVAVGANYLDVCQQSARANDRDAAQAFSGIENVLRGMLEEFTMEYPCHSPQEERWFFMTVVPLGGKGGAVITHLNITQRRKAEQELKTARFIAEQAQAEAVRANNAKDKFMAMLSHELRTPLAPVLATVSLLQQASHLDADTQESLEVIRRNCEMEARLIDDLLDANRIIRGKVELVHRPIQLSTVIERAVEVCRLDIEARKLEFKLDLSDGAFLVDADAVRLQQVFWNLIKNAVKFTPPGGRVAITCRRDCAQAGDAAQAGAENVIAEVSDTGVGIEPATMPGIFNAFEQGGAGTTRQFGGLGLGLTISKEIVELHGGTLTVRSEGKGKGATFAVCLPLLPAATEIPEKAPDAPRIPNPLRILLVEDHRDTALIMRRLLMVDGHQVETAGDVATAIEAARRNDFDLLLSDLGLPDGSGLDLIRSLRQSGFTLPAIALSGYGQEEDVAQSRAAGFAQHLIKPVTRAQLKDAIAAIHV